MRDRRLLAALGALLLVLLLLGVVYWLLPRAPQTALPEVPEVVATRMPAPPKPRPVLAEGQAPPERSWHAVHCLLPVPVGRHHEPLPMVVDDPYTDEAIPVAGDLTRGDSLTFSAPYDDGAALVTLPGYEQAGLIWFVDEDGVLDCLFPVDPVRLPHGLLRLPGVAGSVPADFVMFGGCGVFERAAAEPVEVEVPAGPCRVKACRVTHPLNACGPEVEVVIQEGTTTTVALEIPAGPLAGPGLEVRVRDDGVLIGTVTPGSPAEAAGLVAGDTILAIDEQDVVGLADDDRILAYEALIGLAGETVRLEVEHRDGSITVHDVGRSSSAP